MEQLRASWVIVLFGTILFISGTVMLFWNEVGSEFCNALENYNHFTFRVVPSIL